mgnify:CR=1 FL=1
MLYCVFVIPSEAVAWQFTATSNVGASYIRDSSVVSLPQNDICIGFLRIVGAY